MIVYVNIQLYSLFLSISEPQAPEILIDTLNLAIFAYILGLVSGIILFKVGRSISLLTYIFEDRSFNTYGSLVIIKSIIMVLYSILGIYFTSMLRTGLLHNDAELIDSMMQLIYPLSILQRGSMVLGLIGFFLLGLKIWRIQKTIYLKYAGICSIMIIIGAFLIFLFESGLILVSMGLWYLAKGMEKT